MRNLKKVLSLALALVMLLGMMMIGAGAATTKATDLSAANQEALAVLKATKVMTNARYDDNVTRAEAAKMVLTIYNPTLAKGVKNTKNSVYFTDVKNHWAAGYIDLCFSEGIVSGRTKNVFDPNGTVTGYELGKMILKAMGSEKKYTGSTWTSKVMKDVTDLGLSANTKIGSNWDKALTRVQTAQLVFNGLTKSISGATNYVLYQADGTTRVPAYANTVFSSMSEAIMMKLASGSAGDTWIAAPYTASDALINNFPTLVNTPAKTDAFGRTSNVWTMDGKTVYSSAAGATKIYTAPATSSQIYNDLGLTAASVTATTNIDGVSDTFTLDRAVTNSTIGAVGATTYAYKTGANSATISVVTNYLAKVTKVNAAKAATATAAAVPASVEATVYGVVTADGASLTGKTFETADFAKDQYVVVTVKKTSTANGSDWTIQSMEAADSVEGVMTAYNGTTSLTVNGTAMPIADVNTKANTGMKVNPASILFQNTWTYYAKDGVILGGELKQSAVSTDYVYVVSTQAQKGADTLFGTSGNAVKANVIFAADGANAVIDLAIGGIAAAPTYAKPAANGTVAPGTALPTTEATAQPVGNWFAYTVNDGKYTLQALNANYAASVSPDTWQVTNPNDTSGVELTKDAPKTLTANGTKYTTNTTQIVTVDSKNNRTVTTGLVAAKLSGKVLVTYAPGSSVVSALVAVGQPAPVQTAANYAYAVKQGATTAVGNVWTFAVNGAQADFTIASGGTQPVAGKVYTLNTGANNTFTVEAVTTAPATAKQVTLIGDTHIIVDSTVYSKASSFVVYNASSSASVKGEADTLEDGDFVILVASNNVASVVYIVDDPALNCDHSGSRTQHAAAAGTDCAHKGTIEYYTCDVCGKAFASSSASDVTELTSEQINNGAYGSHDWDTEWTSNDTHHWHECKTAGCHVTDNAQKNGYTTHSAGSWDNSGTTHTKSCTVCEKLLDSHSGTAGDSSCSDCQ